MRAFLLLALAVPAAAADIPARSSAGILEAHPEAFAAGRCAEYRERGHGLPAAEPPWFVRGRIAGAEVRERRTGRCPAGPDGQFDRAGFIRLALAWPCSADADAAAAGKGSERIGIVRLTVLDWETPHERRAATAGRLWRGSYLDKELKKAMEIELEADLLGACPQ